MNQELERRLGDNCWLGGDQPSREDAMTFNALGENVPDQESHPSAYAWYILVSRFTEEVRSQWAAAAPRRDLPRLCQKHQMLWKYLLFGA